MSLAGDDPNHPVTAARIVEGMGFDPVVIGDLADSWRVQQGNPAYVGPYRRAALIE
ncbi:hypothetical protein [Xanthomonas sp. A1809]|uniref:hypothetical protein n=1 Tax=Xanthomonas sp. A1809 TaxID=2821275 RepID=UPI001ADB305E|nr:hypothetical protein [Xanthomonas sp. A1809]MBO9855131.1 hypothetical protein [Xanthomonas sp. A1809]